MTLGIPNNTTLLRTLKYSIEEIGLGTAGTVLGAVLCIKDFFEDTTTYIDDVEFTVREMTLANAGLVLRGLQHLLTVPISYSTLALSQRLIHKIESIQTPYH